jgi:hypothetical protein
MGNRSANGIRPVLCSITVVTQKIFFFRGLNLKKSLVQVLNSHVISHNTNALHVLGAGPFVQCVCAQRASLCAQTSTNNITNNTTNSTINIRHISSSCCCCCCFRWLAPRRNARASTVGSVSRNQPAAGSPGKSA